MAKVFRNSHRPTQEELRRLALILDAIYLLTDEVLRSLNGVALVKWLDPLCTMGRASRYFVLLGLGLEDEWVRNGGEWSDNPFLGDARSAIRERAKTALAALLEGKP